MATICETDSFCLPIYEGNVNLYLGLYLQLDQDRGMALWSIPITRLVEIPQFYRQMDIWYEAQHLRIISNAQNSAVKI